MDIWGGSSPLTRGKLKRLELGERSDGLIPAHAGKTHISLLESGESWAHPRSRGENWARASPRSSAWGSSPLTRGKLPPSTRPGRRARLIPAHAGKTPAAHMHVHVRQAHPRSRGENQGEYETYSPERGSSPLTRGKHGGGHVSSFRLGLIPAHAGKT